MTFSFATVSASASPLSCIDRLKSVFAGLFYRKKKEVRMHAAEWIGGLKTSPVLDLALRQTVSAMGAILVESKKGFMRIDSEFGFEPTFSAIFLRNLPPLSMEEALAIERDFVKYLRHEVLRREVRADQGILRSEDGQLILSTRKIVRPPFQRPSPTGY